MSEPIRGLHLNEADNVIMVLSGGEPGMTVQTGAVVITLRDPVPFGHKVALRAIAAGSAVTKYGLPIGVAACDISPGQHVHVHNVLGHRPDLRGREEVQA